MREPSRAEVRGPLLLVVAIMLMAGANVAFRDRDATIHRITGARPVIGSNAARIAPGTNITIGSTGGGSLLVSTGMSDPFNEMGATAEVTLHPDQQHAASLLAIPLAMQWRHPKAGLPAARVLRAAEVDAIGRVGPVRPRTYLFQDHGALPVIALVMDHEALFDPDSGLMVVGNYILGDDRRAATSYQKDHRWWKYPGNFMGRGKAWQRSAHIEMITANGELSNALEAQVRLNGQMTRGFPQHALRLLFPEPVDPWTLKGPDGKGYRSMVLRAAGNDQVKAMLRDAFQQTVCAGLPFETSNAWPCVVYLNGAYWGVHHLRERIDHQDLSRRHDLHEDQITIVEDAGVLYRGDPDQVQQFNELITMVEKSDGNDPAQFGQLRSAVDMDGFLTYMASQMILGNMDWPEQNVKYWKYTGGPSDAPFADGRWYFIMGDSDLSFGANAPATTDMFIKVRRSNAPIARLFRSAMRFPQFRHAFQEKVLLLLDGPLSEQRMLEHLDRMANAMDPEMDRHTARWRKPLDRNAWQKEVEAMREFARARPGHVRGQIDTNGVPDAF